LQFRSVGGRLFGATIAGQADIDLVNWEKSTGELTCEGLGLADLAQRWAPGEAVQGRLSGVLSFGPADDKRALEPMRIDLSLTGDGVTVEGVDFAGGHATAFAGPRRIVVTD